MLDTLAANGLRRSPLSVVARARTAASAAPRFHRFRPAGSGDRQLRAFVLAFCVTLLAAGCALQRLQESDPHLQGQREATPEVIPQADTRSGAKKAEDSILRGVRGTAAWIDGFLSNERSVAEENRSWVSVRLDSSLEDRSGSDASLRLSGRLVLPRSEDRLHLIFGRDSDDAVDPLVRSDTPPVPGSVTAEADQPVAALQVIVKETERNDIRYETGVRFNDISPDVYVGARWRYTTPLGSWLLSATERLRVYLDAGVESRTSVDFDHVLSDAVLFRSSTRGLWSDQDPGYDYGEMLTFFQRIGERTVLSYEWDTAFVTEPEDSVAETLVRLRWSHRYLENRLLLEIAPQVAWREETGYEPVAGLFLRLEITLGREPLPAH